MEEESSRGFSYQVKYEGPALILCLALKQLPRFIIGSVIAILKLYRSFIKQAFKCLNAGGRNMNENNDYLYQYPHAIVALLKGQDQSPNSVGLKKRKVSTDRCTMTIQTYIEQRRVHNRYFLHINIERCVCVQACAWCVCKCVSV